MFPRIITLIVLATLLGVALLHLRQKRIDAMHDMAQLHRQMDRSRKEQWDLQSRIADRLSPDELRAAFDRAGLKLEPITPTAPPQAEASPAVVAVRRSRHD